MMLNTAVLSADVTRIDIYGTFWYENYESATVLDIFSVPLSTYTVL